MSVSGNDAGGRMRVWRLLLASALAATLCACAWAPPKPWEKGELARPAMQFDADRLEARVQEHVYQSKEAASGGFGVGGGGCGCN
jgi:hypothetical protein